MNTKNLKSYAPKARRQFIEAVTKRAAYFGIYENRISDLQFEGAVAIIDGKAFTKQIGEKRNQLLKLVEEKGFEQFVSELAYTWFNRLAAIRFMELHDYLEHGFRVLSHPEQPTGFEILDHAADACEPLGLDKSKIIELKLEGNKEEVLYRELLLGQCHYLHKVMPFLFEAIDDSTELLLPDNLTKSDSILNDLVNDIPEGDWQEIEVIGWLYQFYISEHKDSVMGKVVKSEDIPAATQLFTPNWIVKYLVHNSLGQLWLSTYPHSSLKAKLEFYIDPVEQTEDINRRVQEVTPNALAPESIRVLDPACGSGHILLEAYDLLKEIYLERGYRLREIPLLILSNNLFGLDIDDRAAQMAGFALLMKAREDDRRIFDRLSDESNCLNVLSLQETINLDFQTIWRDLELESSAGYQVLCDAWTKFETSKTIGSLIEVSSKHKHILESLLGTLNELEKNGSLLQRPAVRALKPIIHQALILSNDYDVIVANPPYMGTKGMNKMLKEYVNKHFTAGKSDLMTCFMLKAQSMTKNGGYWSMINLPSWMFLVSFKELRKELFNHANIESMLHLGRGIFGADFGTVAFSIKKLSSTVSLTEYVGTYKKLFEKSSLVRSPQEIESLFFQPVGEYQARYEDFKKLSGTPIAYWLDSNFFKSLEKTVSLSELADCKQGMATADNNRFVRAWYEVDSRKIAFDCVDRDSSIKSGAKWFPYNKGGSYRKWYGNQELVVNWESDGSELFGNRPKSVIRSPQYYFRECLSWSKVTIGEFSARYYPPGFIFDVAGCSAFFDRLPDLNNSLAALNSPVMLQAYSSLMPTVNYEVGQISSFPMMKSLSLDSKVSRLIQISKHDWDLFESSWGFQKHFLVNESVNNCLIQDVMATKLEEFRGLTQETAALELELNREISKSYNFQGAENKIPNLDKVTLNINPLYRYRGNKEDFKFGGRFQSDSIVELISYAVGCMMGRYSLDFDGVCYAGSDSRNFKELISEGIYDTFLVDEDGILPLTDKEWFEDDVTSRVRDFLKIIYGEKYLTQNLSYISDSLSLGAIKPQAGESSLGVIRRYLSTQFYKDHLRTYKKRPIYWLFSSGKEKAFECLVYLHRYNEGTLSRLRTEYVTPLMGKLDAHHAQLSSQALDATAAQQRSIEKDLQILEKKQTELKVFDEKLKHFADQRISIDLDGGVKVNYSKFGNLLAEVKSVTGKAPSK